MAVYISPGRAQPWWHTPLALQRMWWQPAQPCSPCCAVAWPSSFPQHAPPLYQCSTSSSPSDGSKHSPTCRPSTRIPTLTCGCWGRHPPHSGTVPERSKGPYGMLLQHLYRTTIAGRDACRFMIYLQMSLLGNQVGCQVRSLRPDSPWPPRP